MPLVMIMLMVSVTGLQLIALNLQNGTLQTSTAARDDQRAILAAQACASAMIKALPNSINYILAEIAADPENANTIQYMDGIDSLLLGGDDPYGRQNLDAWCEAEIEEIHRTIPPSGWMGSGPVCFSAVQVVSTGVVYQENSNATASATQIRGNHERTVVMNGMFGPVLCSN